MKKVKILLLAGMLFFISCSKNNKDSEFKIQKGSFKASITETGELLAINAVSINMPSIGFRYGFRFKIIDLVDNGTLIKLGEKIAKIDEATVRKRIIELKTQFNLEQANLNKQIIEQDNQVQSLEIALEEEQANYELKELEMETFKFESPQKRTIKKLEFEQVQINRTRAIRNIQRQKIIKENQIKIQKLKVNQIKLDIEQAYIAVKKLDIVSPINGIVQLKKNRRSKQNYKIGDEIFLNQSFALVPDINSMKVKTSINELDYKKVQLGQKVKVRLDALPEVVFEGKISSLGKLSKPKEQNSKIKVFDAEITIINNDERLKPGMTVSCQIYYADYQNAMYVNNDCLLREKGKYYIFPEKGEKQEVKVGFSNNNYTIILGKQIEGQALFQANRKKESTSEQEA
jgi:hypothetical protein